MNFHTRGMADILADLEKLTTHEKQGDVCRLPVGQEYFPAMSLPLLEMVLLDRSDHLYAVRRISNPIRGARKMGRWQLTGLRGAAAEVLRWEKEMFAALCRRSKVPANRILEP